MALAALPAILEEVAPIAERFGAAGHRVFLVGGVVRDLWLDRPIADGIDLDLTTDALPEQTKGVLGPVADSLWLQGERFGTIGAWVAGRAYEITTHRAESYEQHSRKPLVQYSSAIEEDLSRRDFTVNAMAIELPGGALIDPFGGVGDLGRGVLRTPIDPDLSFTDDPLRMMRAARFAAGYELEPHAEVRQAMAALASRLDIVSAERISDELDKLLVTSRPSVGLRLLADTALLERFLPEAIEHFDDRVEVIDTTPARADLRLTVLVAGADVTVIGGRLRALRCSKERIAYTTAVLAAAEAVRRAPVDAPSYRAWHRAADGHRDDALVVAAAVDPANRPIVAEMQATRAELGDELDDFSLPLSGRDVIDLLGVGEGRLVGEALSHLEELRMERGPLTADEARAALVAWWDARS